MNFPLPRRPPFIRENYLRSAAKDFAAFPHLPLMFLFPFKYNSAAAFLQTGIAIDFT
jgi:hypothetical protein